MHTFWSSSASFRLAHQNRATYKQYNNDKNLATTGVLVISSNQFHKSCSKNESQRSQIHHTLQSVTMRYFKRGVA